MVTPPKLPREFCCGRSRRCEDLRCWLLAGVHLHSFNVIRVIRARNDANRASEVHSLFRIEEHRLLRDEHLSGGPKGLDRPL
jgi:hypothetical protein